MVRQVRQAGGRPRPTGIDGWLRQMLRSHAPDGPALAQVQERASKVEKLLLNDPETGVLETMVGGSVGKGTANKPVKDLDLYLRLDPGVWGDASAPPDARELIESFLDRLRRARRWQYERRYLRVVRQRHSVSIVYQADHAANIDIVPMLEVPGQAGVCWIPRRTEGDYVETAVVRQIRLLQSLDGPRGHLRDGIRLLKLWSRPRALRLPSYALEVLAMYAVRSGCEASAPGVFWAVLDHLGDDQLRTPVHVEGYVSRLQQRFPGGHQPCVIMDPAVVGNNVVYSLRRVEGDEIAKQARYTLARLRKADELIEDGEEDDAEEVFESAWEPPG